jgi:hypothetical protein
LAKNPKKPPIDQIWPPPIVDAKLLFDYFYADSLRDKHELKSEKKKKKGLYGLLFE